MYSKSFGEIKKWLNHEINKFVVINMDTGETPKCKIK